MGNAVHWTVSTFREDTYTHIILQYSDGDPDGFSTAVTDLMPSLMRLMGIILKKVRILRSIGFLKMSARNEYFSILGSQYERVHKASHDWK